MRTCCSRIDFMRQRAHEITAQLQAVKHVSEETEEEDEEYSDYDDMNQDTDTSDDSASLTSDRLKFTQYADLIFSNEMNDNCISYVSAAKFEETQDEITPKMREIAIRWLLKAQQEFGMLSESFFNAVAYFNIITCANQFKKNDLQLVTMVSLWLSTKVEEMAQPSIEDMLTLSGNKYTREQILMFEKVALAALGYRLAFPTPKLFLQRYLDIIQASQQICEIANFLIELSMIYIEFLDYSPSSIAVTAVYLATCSCHLACPVNRLFTKAHVEDAEEVKDCCEKMISCSIKCQNDNTDFLRDLACKIDASVNLILD